MWERHPGAMLYRYSHSRLEVAPTQTVALREVLVALTCGTPGFALRIESLHTLAAHDAANACACNTGEIQRLHDQFAVARRGGETQFVVVTATGLQRPAQVFLPCGQLWRSRQTQQFDFRTHVAALADMGKIRQQSVGNIDATTGQPR